MKMMKKMKMFAMAAIFGFVCTAMVGCDSKRGYSPESPEEVVQQYVVARSISNFEKMSLVTQGTALSEVNKIQQEYNKLDNVQKKLADAQLGSLISEIDINHMKKSMNDDNNCTIILHQYNAGNVATYQYIIHLSREDFLSPWYINKID